MADNTTLVPVSLRVPAEMLEMLDKVTHSMQRPRSWVILRALRIYLANEGQEILDIQEGIDEADRGDTVPVEEILARLMARVGAMTPAK
jgi:predicted transcriptional regulator